MKICKNSGDYELCFCKTVVQFFFYYIVTFQKGTQTEGRGIRDSEPSVKGHIVWEACVCVCPGSAPLCTNKGVGFLCPGGAPTGFRLDGRELTSAVTSVRDTLKADVSHPDTPHSSL